MKKIYQIQLDAFSPIRYEAKAELMIRGAKGWLPEMKGLYTHVATIDVDTAEEVFDLCNLWDDEDKIIWKGKCHSMSVGDIVEFEDGSWYLCDDFGWVEV